MGKKIVEIEIEGLDIACRKFLYGGNISIKECRKCEHHAGVEIVRKKKNNKDTIPVQIEILCILPTRIRAAYRYKEVKNACSR